MTLTSINNISFYEDEDPANLLMTVQKADVENPHIVGSFIAFKAANGNQKFGVFLAGAKPAKHKRGLLKKQPVLQKAEPTKTVTLERQPVTKPKPKVTTREKIL